MGAKFRYGKWKFKAIITGGGYSEYLPSINKGDNSVFFALFYYRTLNTG